MHKKSAIFLSAITLSVAMLLAGAASAAQNPSGLRFRGNIQAPREKPALIGTISAISGNTLTVNDKQGASYSVDISSAKITKGHGKNTQTLVASDLKTGEIIAVMGAVSGNSVIATAIVDSIDFRPMTLGHLKHPTSLHAPGIFGVVTSMNGAKFTVAMRSWDKNSATSSYTINTSDATTYTKDGEKATINDVAVGQMVMILGSVDHTALTVSATKIMINTHKPMMPTKFGIFKTRHQMKSK